jgi:hypothetical protein
MKFYFYEFYSERSASFGAIIDGKKQRAKRIANVIAKRIKFPTKHESRILHLSGFRPLATLHYAFSQRIIKIRGHSLRRISPKGVRPDIAIFVRYIALALSRTVNARRECARAHARVLSRVVIAGRCRVSCSRVKGRRGKSGIRRISMRRPAGNSPARPRPSDRNLPRSATACDALLNNAAHVITVD